MLLRTSSAPVLSALNSSFSQADSVEPSHNVHNANLSSFHSMASPAFHPGRTPYGICAGEDAHSGLGSEQEMGGRITRPPRLSRAQSESDLACFSMATVTTGCADQGMPAIESALHTERSSRRSLGVPLLTAVSPFDLKESILEEIDEPEQMSSMPISSSSLLHISGHDVNGNVHGFVLNDGEVYSSLKLNSCGSPVACNGKGCRPLTESECKQLGFLDMASGIGSDTFAWNHSNDGLSCNFSNSKEAYYNSLLQSDPENPLLLQNYAQHLIKKGEVKKAEEYYERAILADPNDGEVLSHYAKLQWDVNRDQDRAEAYYGQAVQAAPDDCYVMASYAAFLWDVEDNEEMSPGAPALPVYGAPPPASSPLLASA